MIFYLTFNDAPSGIYSSQVIDVVKFIESDLKKKIRLVAFISLRGFKQNRAKIRKDCPDAIVLPMVPGVARWRKNALLLKALCFFKRPSAIIGRSVLATQLAFATGIKTIVYDGRGAIAAEWKEYGVIRDAQMLSEIAELEKQAVLKSSFRIAVTHELVKHWREDYGYADQDHVIIPCTLNKAFETVKITADAVHKAKEALGFAKEDLVLAYSGSVAGWQSFDLLYSFIAPFLRSDPDIKLLFLADADSNILKIKNEFPSQVFHKKVLASDVPGYLLGADHGLLIREETVTNKVASPVKFAEYLACGLPVIISENLGDYSRFVKEQNCGALFQQASLHAISLEEKQRLNQLGIQHFTKSALRSEYVKLLKATGPN